MTLNLERAKAVTTLIHEIHQKGWSPATSTNYSFLNSETPKTIAISQSGIDKSQFGIEHWMLINHEGKALEGYQHLKSSAETLLHTVLYQLDDSIKFILHTHSIYNTVLSQYYEKQGYLTLSNYEVLKGMDGIDTHEVDYTLTIFPNTQDIATLSSDFKNYYSKNKHIKAYLIAGHGLYTWGRSLAEAKRHLEVLEFLLECEYKKLVLMK